MFSWIAVLWQNKFVRDLSAGAAALGALILAIMWTRDQAADEREEEVRDENDRNALKQQVEIADAQDEQVKEADDIRRDADPKPVVPEWMRLKPESD